MAFSILTINPGSTSTKVALFKGAICAFDRVIRHDPDELAKFPTAASQLEYRFEAVKKIVTLECGNFRNIDAFSGRGGLLRPLKGGTYIVGEKMLEDLKASRYGDHASNLGAIIAAKLAQEYDKIAYVVDPIVVDELMDEARVAGLPEIACKSVFHALNQRAAAMCAATEKGIEYNKGKFIVAHLGGGISVGAHYMGCVIDVNNALEEGPFSPERAGNLPTGQLVELCFSGQHTKQEIMKMLAGRGGLFAHTGTTDCEKLVLEAKNDNKINTVLNAMIYKISREICACAAALCGEIDAVVITGGLAYSKFIVEGISKRVSFLGTILVYPGEDEMVALANGAIKVLEGKEKAFDY